VNCQLYPLGEPETVARSLVRVLVGVFLLLGSSLILSRLRRFSACRQLRGFELLDLILHLFFGFPDGHTLTLAVIKIQPLLAGVGGDKTFDLLIVFHNGHLRFVALFQGGHQLVFVVGNAEFLDRLALKFFLMFPVHRLGYEVAQFVPVF